MTRRQLLEMVRRNRGLRELRVGCVTGVDLGFVRELAEMEEVGLRSLEVQGCANLGLGNDGDFEWVGLMVGRGLVELKFEGCEGVDGEVLSRLCEERGWEGRGLKVMPDQEAETKSCDGDLGGEVVEGKGGRRVLEVDPEYV